MTGNPRDAAFDIETTGLDPWSDTVVTIACVSNNGDEIEAWDVEDYAGDERALVEQFDSYLSKSKFDLIVTWNGSEFDLPFLGTRMLLSGAGLFGGPHLRPVDQMGKYGKPRYASSWWGTPEYDVAYDWENYCTKYDLKWSLRPLCGHLQIGSYAQRLDFAAGASILDLTRDERVLYCASDAQQVLGLHQKEDTPTLTNQGQAVRFQGPMTIL